jgi:hypothetical protein
MSQTACERCEFAVQMRWRHASGDFSRPNHADQNLHNIRLAERGVE